MFCSISASNIHFLTYQSFGVVFFLSWSDCYRIASNIFSFWRSELAIFTPAICVHIKGWSLRQSSWYANHKSPYTINLPCKAASHWLILITISSDWVCLSNTCSWVTSFVLVDWLQNYINQFCSVCFHFHKNVNLLFTYHGFLPLVTYLHVWNNSTSCITASL